MGLEIGISGGTVLAEIEAGHLFFLGDAHADYDIDEFEQNQAGDKRPDKASPDAGQLNADLFPGKAINTKNAGRQGAPSAADTVDRNSADRVVNPDFVEPSPGLKTLPR